MQNEVLGFLYYRLVYGWDLQLAPDISWIVILSWQKKNVLVRLFPDEKNSIFTRVLYTTMPLNCFTNIIDPILTIDRNKSFVFYTNSCLLIDRTSEQYDKW